MNLASRCRDAIGQVASLRKQLQQQASSHQSSSTSSKKSGKSNDATIISPLPPSVGTISPKQRVPQPQALSRMASTDDEYDEEDDEEEDDDDEDNMTLNTLQNNTTSPPAAMTVAATAVVVSEVLVPLQPQSKAVQQEADEQERVAVASVPTDVVVVVESSSSSSSSFVRPETTNASIVVEDNDVAATTASTTTPFSVRRSIAPSVTPSPETAVLADSAAFAVNRNGFAVTKEEATSQESAQPVSSVDLSPATAAFSPLPPPPPPPPPQQELPPLQLVSSDDYPEESLVVEEEDEEGGEGSDGDQFDESTSALPIISPFRVQTTVASLRRHEDQDEDKGLSPLLVSTLSTLSKPMLLPAHNNEASASANANGDDVFPRSASPKLGRAVGGGAGGGNGNRMHHHAVSTSNYNDVFPGDLTAPPPHSSTYRRKENGLPLDQPSKQGRVDKSTLSSIDAFEASFNTNFPDSFSPPSEVDQNKSDDSIKGIYNPFLASPSQAMPDPPEHRPTRDTYYAVPFDRSKQGAPPPQTPRNYAVVTATAAVATTPSPKRPSPLSNIMSKLSFQNSSSPPSASIKSKKNSAVEKTRQALFPRSTSPTTPQEDLKSEGLYQTPPNARDSASTSNRSTLLSSSVAPVATAASNSASTGTSSSSISSQVQRMEKAGYQEARARFERVMQSRSLSKKNGSATRSSGNTVSPFSASSSSRANTAASSGSRSNIGVSLLPPQQQLVSSLASDSLIEVRKQTLSQTTDTNTTSRVSLEQQPVGMSAPSSRRHLTYEAMVSPLGRKVNQNANTPATTSLREPTSLSSSMSSVTPATTLSLVNKMYSADSFEDGEIPLRTTLSPGASSRPPRPEEYQYTSVTARAIMEQSPSVATPTSWQAASPPSPWGDPEQLHQQGPSTTSTAKRTSFDPDVERTPSSEPMLERKYGAHNNKIVYLENGYFS